MKRRQVLIALTLLAGSAVAPQLRAQQGPPPAPPQGQNGQPGPPFRGGPPPRGMGQRGPGPGQGGPGPAGRGGRPRDPAADMEMPPGRWWNDSKTAQAVGLSAAQIKKMDETFNGARDRLIDLDAAVRKAEGGLQPLLEADPIDRGKVMGQIERLTQAKADLQKTNAQMLLDIRLQLTHDQWTKLASLRPPPPPAR
jgi:Spy/CpxP family protein refolding chaperone